VSTNGTRRRRRGPPLPKHPYRDSAIMYGVLAAAVVGVTLLTNGSLARGAVFAAIFFVVATAWTWWRFRTRLAREQESGR
jgi:membrane protein implicated in regulation of membrane protease activity